MSVIYEKVVAEDLNLGTGTASVTNPAGGTLTGTQINMQTFRPQAYQEAAAISGGDFSSKVAAAAHKLPSTGGIVDARGLNASQVASTDPFSGITVPIHLLLGQCSIAAATAWNPVAGSRISGDGTGLAKLIWSDPTINGIVLLSNSSVSGLYLQGPNTGNFGQEGTAITTGGSSQHDITIENNVISQWSGYCVNTGNSGNYSITIRNNFFDRTLQDGGVLINPTIHDCKVQGNRFFQIAYNGVDMSGYNNIVTGNTFDQCGFDTAASDPATDHWSILISAYGSHDAINNVVSNNVISNTRASGIEVRALTGLNASYNTISNNTVYSGTSTGAGAGAIALDGSPGGHVDYNTVVGNSVHGNSTHGIVLYGVGASSMIGNIVMGNLVTGNAQTGILLADNAIKSPIVSNTVIGNNTNGTAGQGGIVVSSSAATDNYIVANEVSGNTTNQVLDSGVRTIFGGSAIGNRIVVDGISGTAKVIDISDKNSSGFAAGYTRIGTGAGTAGDAQFGIQPTGGATFAFDGTSNGTFSNPGIMQVAGTLQISSPSNITLANGANNNLAATNKSWLRLSGPTGAFSISGFSGGIQGQVLYVFNTTSQQMTLKNATGSSAGNQISTLTGADVVLRAGTSFATFIYDTASTSWNLIGTN